MVSHVPTQFFSITGWTCSAEEMRTARLMPYKMCMWMGYEEYFKFKFTTLIFSSFSKKKNQYEENETLRRTNLLCLLSEKGTEVPIPVVLQRSTFLPLCSQFLLREWPTWLVHRVGLFGQHRTRERNRYTCVYVWGGIFTFHNTKDLE